MSIGFLAAKSMAMPEEAKFKRQFTMGVSERMLVTGGAGFIGSHLVEALLKQGFLVRVVDSLMTGRRSNLSHLEGQYDWLEGDVSDFEVCRQAVEGVAGVFHEAAIPSVPRSVKEPLLSHASGPTATLNLLEAARLAGVRRFVFAASSSAYGETVELPKYEGILPQPLSPYAAGKLAGEHYVSVYAHTMGLDGVSLRYFNIFGPRQDPSSPYSGVISIFAERMAQGLSPIIYGDGAQTRDFTYVANVVAANLAAMQHPQPLGGAVYNVGTGRRISLLDLVSAINKILGTDLKPEFRPPRAGMSAIPRPVSVRSGECSATSRSSTSRRGCGCTWLTLLLKAGSPRPVPRASLSHRFERLRRLSRTRRNSSFNMPISRVAEVDRVVQQLAGGSIKPRRDELATADSAPLLDRARDQPDEPAGRECIK